jgi:ABC-type sugar transport system ATPase subunit
MLLLHWKYATTCTPFPPNRLLHALSVRISLQVSRRDKNMAMQSKYLYEHMRVHENNNNNASLVSINNYKEIKQRSNLVHHIYHTLAHLDLGV